VDPIGVRGFRRSIYVQVRRSLPLTVLESFDQPVMTPNCELRTASTVAPQSLTMLNDIFVATEAEHFATRLLAENPGSARSQVHRAWKLVYGADPTEHEMSESLVYLAEQTEQIRAELAEKDQTVRKKDDQPPAADPQKLALASFCQALISADRFLYID
jgi:hypothetical protein